MAGSRLNCKLGQCVIRSRVPMWKSKYIGQRTTRQPARWSALGPNSDLTALKCDFRYAPESRNRLPNRPCPKSASRADLLNHLVGDSPDQTRLIMFSVAD